MHEVYIDPTADPTQLIREVNVPNTKKLSIRIVKIDKESKVPLEGFTVPTAKSVVDFHHQVIAHAGRTERSPLFDATLEKRALFMPPPSCATRREAAYIYKTKEPEKPAAFPRFRALQDW